MDTCFYTLGSGNDEEALERAGNIIKKGGLVAFPTETVYGLGGDALSASSSAKIYAAKGRPSDNPLIVHIAETGDLEMIAEDIPEKARTLAKNCWPGPLTMILKKKPMVPDATTGGLPTVAVRMPDHAGALSFIRKAGGFVAAPSANISGRPSPTDARHVLEDMDGRIEMILDGGPVGIGIESTIVDLTGEVPCLLRPGYIGIKKLTGLIGGIEIDPVVLGVLKENERPKAPGMKYRHYAPKGDLVIVKGEALSVADKINTLVREHLEKGESAGVIATSENLELYTCGTVRCVGSRERDEEIAHNLFSLLREFDDLGVEHIYSEELDTPRLGMAVMNRLNKAAGHKIIEV